MKTEAGKKRVYADDQTRCSSGGKVSEVVRAKAFFDFSLFKGKTKAQKKLLSSGGSY
jgi:hypothetical protein